MRESEIEEGIMKGSVEECIEEKKPDICIRQETEASILLNIMILLLDSILFESEFTMRASGDGQDDDAGDEEADAGKKHLASGHVCRNLIFFHSHFDQWVSPSPRDCSRKGEQAYPYRALKYTECICFFLFHYIYCRSISINPALTSLFGMPR